MKLAITLTIEEKFSPFCAKINATINGLIATVEALHDKLEAKDETVKMLKTENFKLNKRIADLQKANDNLEQFCRKDNQIISGLPAIYAEEVAAVAEDVTIVDAANTTVRLKESSNKTSKKVIAFIEKELTCTI